jgi:hypothetical protein
MVKLIKSFPYDNNYDYTKIFSSKAEQTSYFNSFYYDTIDNTNYIKQENSFNVNYEFDELQNDGVNYLIFNNGYRDIYAFIIKKEYLRKNVTKLIYEIDVLQTFMFDFSFKNSYIERKVCSLNEIVDYDEGIDFGEHKIVSDTLVFSKGENYFAMFSGIKNFEVKMDANGKVDYYAEIPSSEDKPMTSIDGINYPLFFMPLPGNNIPQVLSDHPSLVGIVRFPNCTYTTQEIKIPYLMKTVDVGLGQSVYMTVDYVVDVAENITSVDSSGSGGSVAKNEVCDFFPYTYYVLTDGEGQPIVMKPQNLPDSISVVGQYALSHQPIERFYVEGYMGDYQGKVYNITNTNQMMLPTASREGMAYISANGASMKMERDNQVFNNIISGTSGVAGALLSGDIGGLFNAVGNVASGINQIKAADQRNKNIMTTPDSIKSFGTPSTRNAFGTNSVRVLKYTISEIAKN